MTKTCPKCQKTNTIKKGFLISTHGKTQKYQCQNCGHIFTEQSNKVTKTSQGLLGKTVQQAIETVISEPEQPIPEPVFHGKKINSLAEYLKWCDTPEADLVSNKPEALKAHNKQMMTPEYYEVWLKEYNRYVGWKP